MSHCFCAGVAGRKRTQVHRKHVRIAKQQRSAALNEVTSQQLIDYICLKLYARLNAEDQRKADRGKASDISWKAYSAAKGGSVVAATIRQLRSDLPREDWQQDPTATGQAKRRQYESEKKRLLRWFTKRYGPEARITELPQQRKDAPTPADSAFMRDILTHHHYRWADQWSNMRRYPTLQRYVAHVQSLGVCTERDSKALAQLDKIRAYTHKTLAKLTEATAALFKLRKRPEKFKPKRNTAGAQRSAGVMVGVLPMIEAYYSKQEVARNEGGTKQAPDALGAPRAPQWHKVIQTDNTLTKTDEQLKLKKPYCDLKLDDGAYEIMASVDGATIYATADLASASNDVFYLVRCPIWP